ncbi:IclR family transcriptional regulator [Leucobacter sp. HY1910]
MAARPLDEVAPIRSADRVLQVLDAVAEAPDGLTARELASELGLTAPTTYRLLGTLTGRGYLVRTRAARYLLGRAVEHLGRAMHAQLAVTPGVREVLSGLRDAARAPAYLTVFRGGEIAVAYVADSTRYRRIGQLHVGFNEAAHVTAFGKLMLSGCDERELTGYLEQHGLARVAPQSVTNAAELRAQLEDVRAQQLAVEVDEYMPHLACIAAPVRSPSGGLVGAVSLSTSSEDFAARAHELERMVRRGAWHVSSSLASSLAQ